MSLDSPISSDDVTAGSANPPRSKTLLARRAIVALGLLAAAVGITHLYLQQLAIVEQFRFDDAYITLRYAQQLATHGVLSFNSDEWIDGYTSPAWALILAACERLGFDGVESMLVLGRISGLAAIFAAVVLARVLGARWPFAIAVGGFGPLFTPGFIVWSVPGMEMPFAAFVYTASLAAFAWPPTRPASTPLRMRTTIPRATWLFLATLARPEGALLAAMLFFVELALLRAETRAAGQSWIRTARPHIALAAILGSLFAYRWHVYGYPLPNTFYAKSSTPGLITRGIDDAIVFVSQRGFWLAPIAALALASGSAAPRRRWTLVVFAIWVACVLIVYARSGGDFPGFHRFYQPMVPAAFAVIATLLSKATEGANDWFQRAAGALTALACCVCLVRSDRTVLPEAFAHDTGAIRSQTDAVAVWERAGVALRRALPRPTRMAIRAAGVLPLRAQSDFVYDTLALNNPDVAHHNESLRDVPAHQKEATLAQILRWRPNVIVGHPDIEASDLTGHPAAWMDSIDLRNAGYRFRCVSMAPREFICFWQRG